MDAKLWNIGMKVKEVDAEVAYFLALGATLIARERLDGPDGEIDYALMAFGGTRLFLTPRTIFEDALPEPLRHGLTHAVFEVAELEPEIERLAALGTEMLLPPTELTGQFGKRRLAFFRSPGGLVFELLQIVSRDAV